MSNNLNNWLTKQQVAQLLCVAEKTVDRMAAPRGKEPPEIQKATRKRPGLPPQSVFHPDDVARAKAAREKGPGAFLMPSQTDGGQVVDISGGQPERQVSDVSKLPPMEAWTSLIEALVEAIKPKQLPPAEPPLSELRQLLIVTRAEAKRLGYTATILRQVRSLPGKRYKMRDLEEL